MKKRYVIGTRGSELALWQTNFVKEGLESFFPDFVFETKTISTTGDQLFDITLSKIGDKGLFTRQIETELLNGEIDFAVHSLKDLQTGQPDGLVIGAVCEREIANDAFVSSKFNLIDELPAGASVATGSLRRRSQLLNFRPDLKIVEIRGNVPTRLKKYDGSNLDAMILAFAGLHRLGLQSRIRQIIPFDIMLPAVGQGAIAVEVRRDDQQILKLARKLNHVPTRVCIEAERGFLRRLEGGCQVPIGALAVLESNQIWLKGFVGNLDGSVAFREQIDGDISLAKDLGKRLAEMLIEKGADDLLAQARTENAAFAETVM